MIDLLTNAGNAGIYDIWAPNKIMQERKMFINHRIVIGRVPSLQQTIIL